jgi:hypothetical protein
MANRNWANGGKIMTMEYGPVVVSCNFIVDSTNGNGLGIRSLKGPTVKAVYMNTSAPLAGSGNPNPSAGTIVIQLQDNYNRSLAGFNTIVSPLSGTPLTATTSGTPVVIVALGTATRAQWTAVGLPLGISPAVGVAFVPTASATIGGSAAVEIAAAAGSTIMSIETLGDPNTTIAPNPTANQGFGAQLIVQCRNVSGAIAAPANGTVIAITMYLSNSSVNVQGE